VDYSITRRRWAQTLAGVAITSVLAGCAGDGGSEYDVRIEYETTVGKEPEQMPENIRDSHRGSENPDGRRKEGHKWIVVEIYVEEGELNMEDLWFRSRVETEDRFYDLDHASGDLTDGIQSRGDIQEGGYGLAVYQIPDDREFVDWNLDETHQDIRAQER
jgi:hypothetical protein